MGHLKQTRAFIMKNALTSYYTFLLINERRKFGKVATMRAVKLQTKLQDLNK